MHCNAPTYPDKPGPRACIKCAHFVGWAPYIMNGKQVDGELAICRKGGHTTVTPSPHTGCVHWMREIGADDE